MKTHKQIEAERLRYINYSERLVGRELAKLRRSFRASAMELGPENALNQLSQADIAQSVQAAYVDMYTVTGVAFAKSTVRGLGKIIKKDTADTLESSWIRHMQNFARTRCAEKIQSVTRNIFNDIENVTRQIVEAGSAEGWGPARVATEIWKQMGQRDHWRAMRIARTEVVGASNEGAIKGARDFGFKTKKKWLVNLDSETRDDHAAMADQPAIPTDEKFNVGGEEMDYPGDPSASVENVVNCRCAIDFEPERDIIDDLLSGNYDREIIY
jgi:hypothetical protein